MRRGVVSVKSYAREVPHRPVARGVVAGACAPRASSAFVQSQTTPIAVGVTGDAASAVGAQKKKALKHPIAQSSAANCAAASSRTTVRGIDASGNPYVETVDADGTRRHRTRGQVTITSPNGKESTLLQANAPAPTAPPQGIGIHWLEPWQVGTRSICCVDSPEARLKVDNDSVLRRSGETTATHHVPPFAPMPALHLTDA